MIDENYFNYFIFSVGVRWYVLNGICSFKICSLENLREKKFFI